MIMMNFRPTSNSGSAGVVTAQDRCPQLEAGQESLTALRLEVTSYDEAEETLAALADSRHLKELSLKSGGSDEEVGRLVRDVLLVNTSIHRLTLERRILQK